MMTLYPQRGRDSGIITSDRHLSPLACRRYEPATRPDRARARRGPLAETTPVAASCENNCQFQGCPIQARVPGARFWCAGMEACVWLEWGSIHSRSKIKPSMDFPDIRLRRLRRTEAMRAFVRETRLHPGALIQPLFVCPGDGVRKPISSMPGVFNLSIDEAVKEAIAATQLGIGGFLLFGLPEKKDDQASGAWSDNGIVQTALRAMKRERALDSMLLIADVCLCEYTSHGHCGVVRKTASGAHEIENDSSVEIISKTAVSLAQAGADIVAPSDMMDGRVAAIRAALDKAQLPDTPILSYASKFASAFYGPFREAADSTPQFGDRRSYQMDGANRREAMREIELDLAEGADMILMKPALPYLDVIREARDRFDVPLGAYQVSGEYAMLHAAFEKGWLDRDRAMLESLISIRRAGADFIVTYFAQAAAKLL
jgi:porphobilinogen synthase